jgi:mono/diheme cytochrome c family protein
MKSTALSSPLVRRVVEGLAIVSPILTLFSCESVNYVPPVTPKMATQSKKQTRQVDLVVLNKGRSLFVNRCIECHTLPAIWKYSRDDWPEIVNSMSHRASLKPAEREAIVAYILAVKAGKE